MKKSAKYKINSSKKKANKLYLSIFIIFTLIVGIISYIAGRMNKTEVNTKEPDTSTIAEAYIPQYQTIFLTKTGWDPASIKIKSGTTVNWVNESFADAFISSNTSTLLNLGTFSRGDTISITFSQPGRYDYINNLLPQEKGTIEVR